MAAEAKDLPPKDNPAKPSAIVRTSCASMASTQACVLNEQLVAVAEAEHVRDDHTVINIATLCQALKTSWCGAVVRSCFYF